MALDPNFLVAVQVNAASLLDEGTSHVLERFQTLAAANTVMVTVYGFNPEVIDRPEAYVGHGSQGRHGSAGGHFGMPHSEYYRGVPLGSARVQEPFFEGFDILADTIPVAHEAGMSVYGYILESADTGGRQLSIPGYPRLLEVDVVGRRSALPCINNPQYRSYKLALIEDLFKSYEFDGFLWGVERWGPLHDALVGRVPTCFCTDCRSVAAEASIDFSRTIEGYSRLWRAVQRWSHDDSNNNAPLIEFLQINLEFPEIVKWEWLWTQRYFSLHKEIYGVAKWVSPERPFGFGLWHYYFINPLLRAEWNLAGFAEYADFLRPILYHLPEGARLHRYLGLLADGLFGGFDIEELHTGFARALDLELPPLSQTAQNGLPSNYISQGVQIVRRGMGKEIPIYAGIGLDVPETGLQREMTPIDVEEAVEAAVRAEVEGIVVSRNYAEMRVENLAAVGETLRGLADWRIGKRGS